MKDKIKKFNEFQVDHYGYIRYKITHHRNMTGRPYTVDAMCRYGNDRVIKTVKSQIDEYRLTAWIDAKMCCVNI